MMLHHFRVAPCLLVFLPLFTNACKSGQSSRVKILNGVANQTGYPATVGLDMRFKKSHRGFVTCTGTVVTPTLVLTAAHCLADDKDDGKVTAVAAWLFGSENKQVNAASWFSNPQYNQGSKEDTDPFDVAFVEFDTGSIPGAAVATLSLVPAAVNDAVTIVGYGDNRWTISDPRVASGSSTVEEGVGTRRMGATKISGIADSPDHLIDIVTTLAANNRGVNVMEGDSGGPLCNAAGAVVGIMVSADDIAAGDTTYVSHSLNIHSSVSSDFISQNIPGFVPALSH